LERFEEAIVEIERSHELDPLSVIINSIQGLTYYFAGRYNESVAAHKCALELDPNFLLGITYAVLAYIANDMCESAVRAIRSVEASATEHDYSLGYFGYIYAVCGQENDALRMVDTLDELAKVRYVSPMHRSFVLVGLGRVDDAIDSLELALAERSPMLAHGLMRPLYTPLLSNPRYKELLGKVGLEV
jgi:tetratricopeptide (TPR) repeat protein